VPVITGQIVRFNHDKGFGFAETTQLGSKKETVFIHISKGRQVVGSADEPDLTGIHEEIHPTNQMQIVMTVDSSPKGWRASAWGVLPKRDWRADLIKSGELNLFIGGRITIRGRRTDLQGSLTAVELTPERLDLKLADAYLNGTPLTTASRAYDLTAPAILDRKLPHGRLAIDIDNNYEGDWHRIVFSLPVGSPHIPSLYRYTHTGT